MNVQTYRINWGSKSYKGDIMNVPFEIVFQTSSLAIEKYVAKTYPQLLTFQTFNLDQLYALQKMKSYIKSNLTQQDFNELANYFYEKGWLQDVPKSGIFGFNIVECSASMWQLKDPFITMQGILTFDLKKFINHFIENKGIVVIHNKEGIIKEISEIRFIKPFPSIITYDGSSTVRNMMLAYVIKMCNEPSKLLSMIERELKIKELHKFKKEIKWIDDKRIKVTIDDYAKLFGDKIKKNAVPLTLAGLALYAVKKNKEKRAQVLQNSINIYQQMLDTVAENYRKK